MNHVSIMQIYLFRKEIAKHQERDTIKEKATVVKNKNYNEESNRSQVSNKNENY